MVPDALKQRTQWLVWRLEEKPGAAKPAKMPYYASGPRMGSRRTGVQGSEEDRACLTTFEHALEYKSRHGYAGVGFAFLPGDGLIGIDLDKCVEDSTDTDTGEIIPMLTERARNIIGACASFTEYSPSGRGVHIYCLGTTDSFKSNDIGVEVFCGRQFFTVTGEHVDGTPPRVNAIDMTVLARLRKTVEVAKGKSAAVAPAPRSTSSSHPAQPAGQQEDDFARVNSAAMASFDAWVPALFPGAKRIAQGYRVTSKSLGRDLQEDLAIHRDGIVDFGVKDMGDAREGRRTPIDLVLEWGGKQKPAEALHWLADKLGVQLRRLPAGRAGRGERGNLPPGEGPHDEGAPDGPPPRAGGDGGDDHHEPPPDWPGENFGGPWDPEGEPLIEIRAGFLPQATDQAEAVLLDRGAEIFQRDRMLVRIIRKPVMEVRNYKRLDSVLGLVPVEQAWLVEQLTRAAHFSRWDAKAKSGRRIDCPDKLAGMYMARSGHWKLRGLWSVVTTPTLRPDGTLLQEPGYDRAMRAWYDPCGATFPAVPEEPTRKDAEAALELLRETISTLPFVADIDEAVALALLLCSVVRRSLPAAPMVAVSASSPNTGKTLLVDCAAILATGSRAPAMAYTDKEEEFAKLLFSTLLEGDHVMLIDNVDAPLRSSALCSALTSESMRMRVLGGNVLATVPTTTLICANGNNLALADDVRTRAIMTRLDAGMERPGERRFAEELKDTFQRLRPRLVVAALTIMRAFIHASKKKTAQMELFPVLGRFEPWSVMVRHPLLWLGVPDPCKSTDELERRDPARAEHLAVLTHWLAVFKGEAVRAVDVCTRVAEVTTMDSEDVRGLADATREIVRDRDGRPSPRKLSRWLRAHVNKHVERLVLIQDGEVDHVMLWRVKQVPS